MILNSVSLGKNSLALRRYVLCFHGVLFQCMTNFSTSLVIGNEGLSKISYLKDGKEGDIGADEEYPNWLWNLRGAKQNVNELDPHSKTYSRLLRKRRRRDENERRKMKRF